ncbi:MAG: hypothetical protein HN353_10630 [Bdellovibrionales bacterium]|jgi:hypothetical protein|nr:hypothetical protein [Bdellovibrionales bacterium]MBT3524749.1 hypothetical protein [Bdellovibrionales bacterium]MBT7669433.1 hypothetical protein [Bdellovibrionales bacterium]MBT7767660.1 hypothetical protein [Bdellovibrionales bacterium]
MPREIVHIKIANTVFNQLANDDFWRLSEEYLEFVRLGSVFHDSLYYHPTSGPSYQEVVSIPDQLHGEKGEDTHDLVRKISQVAFSDYQIAQNSAVRHFLLGIIAHIHTDATFHPMIYYYTGNCYNQDPLKRSIAIQEHRRLESLIDLFFLDDDVKLSSFHIKNSLGHPLLKDVLQIVANLIEIGLDPQQLYHALDRSYQQYGKFQSLYTKSTVRRLFYLGAKLTNKSFLKEAHALFYDRSRLIELQRRQSKLEYLHPVTGDRHLTDLNTLYNASEQSVLSICQTVEQHVTAGTIEQLAVGPSLEVALPQGLASEMKYFAKTSLV